MRLRGAVVVSVIISLALVQSESNAEQKPCDLFEGRWERESESSLYNYTSCPFIQKEFNCRKNGRSDDLYLRYNWQPRSCSLSRMDNQDTRGPGRNKRKWNHDEDVKLIQTLLDMVNLGAFKAENGFKPGYLTYLEDKLKVILPNSELKAKPHIESRIKVLKRDFNIVYDMLNGPNTSGFGMDPIKKCVTAEKPVWDAYLKSHPGHSIWQNKSFPFYDDLLIIFGKDRATGANAEGPNDMMEDIQREQNNNDGNDNVEATADSGFDDFDAYINLLRSPRNDVQNQRKKKRTASSDSLTSDFKEAAGIIGSEIAKASEAFTKAIGVDAEISLRRKQIDSEIRKIPHLSVEEIIKAVCVISNRNNLIDVFFSMNEEGKEQLVQAILNGQV